MAILQVTAFSKCLMRNVPLTVVLPVDRMVASPRTEYPTLYLLHGIFGNTLDFLNGTRIGRWAMERELCVVMPSGENSFYLNDRDQFALWSDFVGKELVELTRRMFPLSHRREDTFLGGVSMGGYGALYNGLQFRDTFSWILALSAPIRLEDLRDRATDNAFILTNRRYAQRCFGDLQTAPERDVNPLHLVERLWKEGAQLPQIYLACGDRDELLPGSKRLAALLERLEIPHIFEILPGAHEWDFWDEALLRALELLPIGRHRKRK